MERTTTKYLQRKAREMLSKNAANRRVAAIDGYLMALESLGSEANHSVSFDFRRIEGTVDRARDAALAAMGEGMKIELTPLADWKRELANDLLQGYIPTALGPELREEIAQGLLILLNRACSDTASAWRVVATPTDGKYFHCAWSTYLFPTPDGLFLLHCAIDD